MNRHLLYLIAALLAAWPVLGLGQDDGEDRQQEASEDPVALPAAPSDGNLVELYVGANTGNRFFVDAASLRVGSDQVIRYTVVVRSPTGARTVNFEGMRCGTPEGKLYAFARADGSWSAARKPQWRPVNVNGPARYQYVLARDYFCPNGVPVANADAALRALKRGPGTEHTN